MNRTQRSESILPELDGWEERLERVLRKVEILRSAGWPRSKDGRITDEDESDLDWVALFNKAALSGADECWVWGGRLMSSGYGMFRSSSASRYVAGLKYGVLRNRWILACHHCDNPPCVNPYHIYAGTSAQNAKDKAVSGRARNGYTKHCSISCL